MNWLGNSKILFQKTNMIIGLSGAARSGKDTFYKLFSKVLRGKILCKRLAFADELKGDLRPLLLRKFNIDPLDANDAEKDLIRPLLVAYGTDLARNIDREYWIKKISKKIKANKVKDPEHWDKTIFVVTDVRYPNEADWVKSFDKSIMVYIERDGIPPANKEESQNCPVLKDCADHVINWPTYNNGETDERINLVKSFINEKIKIRHRAH